MINILIKYLLPDHPVLDNKIFFKIYRECSIEIISHIKKSTFLIRMSFAIFSFAIIFLFTLYSFIKYNSKITDKKKFLNFEKKIIYKIPIFSKMLNSLRAIILLNWYDNEIVRSHIGANSLEERKLLMINHRKKILSKYKNE